MKVNFKETDIFQGFSTLIQQHNMHTSLELYEMTTKGVFMGIGKFLAMSKNTKTPVAFTVTDFKGNVIFVAYCNHVDAAEDQDETKGSWLVDFSFNEEDIPKDAKVTDVKDPIIYNPFDTAARATGYYYVNNSDLIAIIISIFRSLVDWLDVNARENEEVEIEYEGVFTAKVAVENGEKVMGIVVAEEIKNVVKSDGDDLLSKDEVK